jgi:predicted nucleic acid-binding protein
VVDRAPRGLLDTNVAIDLPYIDADALPVDMAISAITLAELTIGPLSTEDPAKRAERQTRLQQVEAAFDPLPFDAEAARRYGAVHAAVSARGRSARRRFADLLIACVAISNDLPLFTADVQDYAGLERLLTVVPVPAPQNPL